MSGEILVVRAIDPGQLEVGLETRGRRRSRLDTDTGFTELCDEGMTVVGQVTRRDEGWLLREARNALPGVRENVWGSQWMPDGR